MTTDKLKVRAVVEHDIANGASPGLRSNQTLRELASYDEELSPEDQADLKDFLTTMKEEQDRVNAEVVRIIALRNKRRGYFPK